MFEKFLSENIESFRQRYEGTYGFYKAGGKRLLVKLTEITPTSCNFQDAQGISFNVRPDHPQDVGFEFLPPRSQWYNTEYGAIYSQRIASRQFQRGVTARTLELHLLAGGGIMNPMRVDFRYLSAIYERQVPVKSAMELVNKQSVALSPHFALDGGLLFMFKEPIGKYVINPDGKFAVNLSEKDLWRVELSDAFRDAGCSAQIS